MSVTERGAVVASGFGNGILLVGWRVKAVGERTVDLCLMAPGGNISVSAEIPECRRIFKENVLSFQMHVHGVHARGVYAHGDSIERKCDTVMAAVNACHCLADELGGYQLRRRLKSVNALTERRHSSKKLLAWRDAGRANRCRRSKCK